MIDISLNNVISMYAGDSFSAVLFLDEGSDYACVRHILQDSENPDEREYICFAIEEPNQPFEKAIVRKKFYASYINKDGEKISNLDNDGDLIIRLDPSDTQNLLPGNYYYEIKGYFISNGKPVINTVVAKTKFVIL